MRLIPEYYPVQKLYLSFVHDFFNIRFHYGKALCAIIKAAHPFVKIELFVAPADLPHWQRECQAYGVSPELIQLNFDSPQRAILAEALPIFAARPDGQQTGLLFHHPKLDLAAEVYQFSRRVLSALGISSIDLPYSFATALVAVNEEVVLVSDSLFQGVDSADKLAFFQTTFPEQHFYLVPGLAGELSHDLDMYLWPIAPKVWIASAYPDQTPQADSIAPALAILARHGHTVLRVPGLAPLIYEDINTVPNYANGVILNQAALVPAYGRAEDAIVQTILQRYGYTVLPINCNDLILSNSAIHCIAKTVPQRTAMLGANLAQTPL